jgi:hypothetical protein
MSFNATTPYSSGPNSSTLLDFFSSFIVSLIVTVPCWFGIRQKLVHYYKQAAEGEISDEEEESEEEGEDYSMNYLTEFMLLEKRALSSEDLEGLREKSVKETTDFGDIIMLYDTKTEVFWYYTDHLKEVSYTLLEAVARKFMVEHDCGGLCPAREASSVPPFEPSSTQEQSQNGSSLTSAEDAQGGVVGGGAPQGVVGGAAPYAKFKKYNSGNRGAASQFNTGIKVIEQPNHFRYKGKLYDYEETLKAIEREHNDAAVPTMTYAAFKQLMDAKMTDTKKEN